MFNINANVNYFYYNQNYLLTETHFKFKDSTMNKIKLLWNVYKFNIIKKINVMYDNIFIDIRMNNEIIYINYILTHLNINGNIIIFFHNLYYAKNEINKLLYFLNKSFSKIKFVKSEMQKYELNNNIIMWIVCLNFKKKYEWTLKNIKCSKYEIIKKKHDINREKLFLNILNFNFTKYLHNKYKYENDMIIFMKKYNITPKNIYNKTYFSDKIFMSIYNNHKNNIYIIKKRKSVKLYLFDMNLFENIFINMNNMLLNYSLLNIDNKKYKMVERISQQWEKQLNKIIEKKTGVKFISNTFIEIFEILKNIIFIKNEHKNYNLLHVWIIDEYNITYEKNNHDVINCFNYFIKMKTNIKKYNYKEINYSFDNSDMQIKKNNVNIIVWDCNIKYNNMDIFNKHRQQFLIQYYLLLHVPINGDFIINLWLSSKYINSIDIIYLFYQCFEKIYFVKSHISN